MVSITESIYKELEDSFGCLKRCSQQPIPASGSKQDGGDKEKAQVSNALRDQFDKMVTRIDELLKDVCKETDEEIFVRLIAMKTSLVYEEAKIKLSLDKFLEGKEFLERAFTFIRDMEFHPFISYLHMRIANHMAFALSKLGDYVSAKTLLKEITTKEVPINLITYSTEELFTVDGITGKDSKLKLHSIYINNLQMLSWVYSKMGLECESAMVLHKILEKELDFDNCDPVDWAMRTTRVASLYLIRGQFVPARYYLSAAGSALDRVEAALIEHAELGKAQAELARGWIYYGLRLFDVSRSKDINKMCNKIFDENVPTTSGDTDTPRREEEQLNEALKFKTSEVAVANVPASIITDINDARMLFQHTQMWLKRARVFYTLRDYPFIYVNCVLDLSELYRFLAFYEPELETQYSVQKRRADALETLSTILKEVRPQCYIAVSVELLRELAEVQIELMGINLKKMYKMHGWVKDVNETQDSIKHRMEGVYDIQTKLEKISQMFGQASSELEMNHASLMGITHPSRENIPVSGLADNPATINQVNTF